MLPNGGFREVNRKRHFSSLRYEQKKGYLSQAANLR